MELSIADFRINPTGLDQCTVTIGNFDGVHLGHRALLATTIAKAKELGVVSALLTFTPHPAEIIRGVPVARIYPTTKTAQLVESMGVDRMFVQTFDEKFSQFSGADFLRQFLIPHFSPLAIIIGDDFSFGKNKQGSASVLSGICVEHAIELVALSSVVCRGTRISSSRIRKCLEQADLPTANELLGAPYEISGLVVAGQQLGRKLGFPTANLQWQGALMLPYGVYLIRVHHPQGVSHGVANYGRRPTVVSDQDAVLECHLLDFSGDLYGQLLRIEFHRQLREERKFADINGLTQQIKADIAVARTSLQCDNSVHEDF